MSNWTYKFGFDTHDIAAEAKVVLGQEEAASVVDESTDALSHEVSHGVRFGIGRRGAQRTSIIVKYLLLIFERY